MRIRLKKLNLYLLLLGVLCGCQRVYFRTDNFAIGSQRDDGEGDREELLHNSAFEDPDTSSQSPPDGEEAIGTDTSGQDLSKYEEDSVLNPNAPASEMKVIRLCSDKYSNKAQTNLYTSTRGVMVALHSLDDGSSQKSIYFEDPTEGIRIRETIINSGRFHLPLGNVSRGRYQLQMCDVARSGGCREKQTSSVETHRFASKSGLLALATVNIDHGRLQDATGSVLRLEKLEVLANKSLQDHRVDPGDLQNCDEFSSPLMIDTDNTGIDLTAPLSGAKFDIDADGILDQISWPRKPSTMLLVLDLNKNGKIDNGHELFGASVISNSGQRFRDGFEALAQYDSNADQRIDHEDAIFSQLRLWSDENGNALSEPSELLPLKALSMDSIDLNFQEAEERDHWANATKYRSVVNQEGSLRMITGIWLRRIN